MARVTLEEFLRRSNAQHGGIYSARYRDRLSRVGFDLFKHLFKYYHTDIVVLGDVGSEKLDSQEIFEEIVSLLHCYSMKLYSSRRVKRLKEVLESDEDSPEN